jgi:filamentous hemagglutinin
VKNGAKSCLRTRACRVFATLNQTQYLFAAFLSVAVSTGVRAAPPTSGAALSGNNVTLDAARDLTIQSALESSDLHAKNKSSSASIGISFGFSGFGIVIGASSGHGKGEGRTENHTESTVAAADTLTLTSGRDTNLKGAIVSGETVKASVGRDLNLASEQDIDDYKNKQSSAGGSVMIGAGFSASASYSQGSTESTYC